MDGALLILFNALTGKLVKEHGPLAPGTYTVDETVTVRLVGTVNKLEDESYTPTVSIPWLAVMALFTEKVRGVVQEGQKAKVESMVIEAMTEALKADAKADPYLKSLLADMKAAEAKVRSMVDALPDAVRTGKTLVDDGAILAVVPAAPLTVNVP